MGLGKISDIKHFNSHAHVERDSVGFWGGLFKIYFNSHAHVERDSEFLVTRNENIGFQLTRSRGAWLKIPSSQ